jgi:nitronate monooxygenase
LGLLAFVLVFPCVTWLPTGEAVRCSTGRARGNATLEKGTQGTTKRVDTGATLALALLSLAYFLEGIGYIVTGAFLPIIVEDLPGLDGLGTGVWILVGLAAVPCTVLWAGVEARSSATGTLDIAFTLQDAGILLPTGSSAWWAAAGSAVLFGGKFTCITALTLTYAQETAGPGGSGLAMGLLTVLYGVGQLLGSIIPARLADVAGGLGTALVAASAVVTLGGLLMPAVGLVGEPTLHKERSAFMTMNTRVTKALGIEYPILQAPMAGGPTTPELVAAVSNAGGLGSLGAAYLPPETLREQVREIRKLTEGPFGVNLFVPSPFEADPTSIERANALLGPYRKELGIEVPEKASSFEESFEDQLEVILEERVPIFSFTFGVAGATHLRQLRESGITTLGTATTVREGLRLEEDGADMVVAQGSEAGGHRGTFLGNFEDALIGTMALVPQMVDALSVPVVASGGIMDGRGLAAALVLGAEAAQMGTAFLACEESGAHPEFKRAVLKAAEDETTVTRAFSGRAARGVKNRFLIEVGEHEDELPPFPVQNTLTKDVRAAAQEQDRPEFMSLWAGQAVRLARLTSAADLVGSVVEGAEGALRELAQRST